jgi:hypothetical protein
MLCFCDCLPLTTKGCYQKKSRSSAADLEDSHILKIVPNIYDGVGSSMLDKATPLSSPWGTIVVFCLQPLSSPWGTIVVF